MTTKTLVVPMISCDHCASAIKGALEPIRGVQSVSVDVPAKKVQVQYDEGAVTLARIKQAVEEEDYSVALVE